MQKLRHLLKIKQIETQNEIITYRYTYIKGYENIFDS